MLVLHNIFLSPMQQYAGSAFHVQCTALMLKYSLSVLPHYQVCHTESIQDMRCCRMCSGVSVFKTFWETFEHLIFLNDKK